MNNQHFSSLLQPAESDYTLALLCSFTQLFHPCKTQRDEIHLFSWARHSSGHTLWPPCLWGTWVGICSWNKHGTPPSSKNREEVETRENDETVFFLMSSHGAALAGRWSWPCHRRYSGVVSMSGWSQWCSSCTSSHGKLVPVRVQPLPGPSTASHGPVDTYGTGQQFRTVFKPGVRSRKRYLEISPLPHCRVHQRCRVLRRDQLWLGSACGTSPLALQLNWRQKQTNRSIRCPCALRSQH